MNGQIIKPPTHVEIDGPSVFLAGPIRGSADWQEKAIGLIQGLASWLHVTSPRRPGFLELSPKEYFEQVDWEHHYLDLAARHGVTLFWLSRETEHVCSRAYAQTTRFELGEAMMRHRTEGARLVVGWEDGFSNRRYLEYTLRKKAPEAVLARSLEETCEQAVRLAEGLRR